MARILIIDDDNLVRRMLRQVLEATGYEVVEAEDGTKGLEMNRERQSDLIITDIIMPEKEGIETIGDLKREFPDVPIIAMSGGGRIGPDAYLKMAKDFGAMRTIVKPINKSELLEAAKQLLEGDSDAK